jgi:excisionase family DNA binding protein
MTTPLHHSAEHAKRSQQGERIVHLPFSLSVKEAARHFGFHPKTLYDWISLGRLHRGVHYLKIGKKVLIVREAFIEFLQKEDGTSGGSE